MIAGNRDRIEFRHVLRSIGKNVRYDPHARLGRIDISIADHELFQNVILNCASELIRANALFFGGDDVERHDRQNRAIHRHRDRHLIQRNAGKQRAHVINAIYRHAGHADIARDTDMIAVIAAMRGEIEGHRQAFLARGQVAAIEGIGVFSGREAGILPNGPGPLRVHGRVGATTKRREAWIIIEKVEILGVSCTISGGEVDAFRRGERAGARGAGAWL